MVIVDDLCFRYNKNDLTHGVLYWGDERGHVSAVEFSGCRDVCFFSVRR